MDVKVKIDDKYVDPATPGKKAGAGEAEALRPLVKKPAERRNSLPRWPPGRPVAYRLTTAEPDLKQMLTVRRPSFRWSLKLRLLQNFSIWECLPSARDARLAKIGPTPGNAR